ncbi:peptide chain release factor N(5)-glutamine methyltransferase [Marinobacter sp. M216]|uniref:Release factor glutamine methyltransferase n=1 Tax=Marinobacter albus TaxID=3030833 RepID=A0ABT7HG80_9GAMM|nr:MULTISPECIES: peptide chain release factor N(5)-glutamine methyltransferase [unclassified Marinobacter]MBW7472815.1 peptide chain release factor N(5)-glutamine methyltransferase [Marinobacter sp. F4218]MDK9559368.1 peptide chain release factor N(5)-glutamine methyltransferase [Marinobacter sp. M216]
MTSKPSLTCESLLQEAARRIAGETPRLDAELLLSHVTRLGRTSFRAWPEQEISATHAARFEELVSKRVNGTPVAYLLGNQEFWSLPLHVSSSTLIPRPDTECLVEAALSLPLPVSARVLDLGTGTGAIALALASEHREWQVSACDCVPEAVELAQRNARELGLPVSVTQSSWFRGLSGGPFDLVVSNPPYIAAEDHHLEQGDVRFEPASALVSGADGLDDLRVIINESPDWLEAGGWLLVEHGFDQAAAVRALFEARGFVAVESRKDYGNQERMTLGQWPQGAALPDQETGDQDAQ